jgi:hypothetical protein
VTLSVKVFPHGAINHVVRAIRGYITNYLNFLLNIQIARTWHANCTVAGVAAWN